MDLYNNDTLAENQTPMFIWFLVLIAAIIIIGAIAWVLLQIITPIYNANPTALAPYYFALLGILTFIDASVWVIVIIGGLYDLARSWSSPDIRLAFINIIGIFLVAYISFTFIPAIVSTNNAISISSIFPTTYKITINGYLTFIVILLMVLSAIFNVRREK